MNKQKFSHIVKNYQDIPPDERNKLHEVAREYPYSQIIHTLIAKANMDASTPIARQTLGVAAMYAADRQVLKSIIGVETSAPAKAKRQPAAKPASSPAQRTQKARKTEKAEEEISSPEIGKGTKVSVNVESIISDDFPLRDQILKDLEELEESKLSYLAWLDEPLEVKPAAKEEEQKKKNKVETETSDKTTKSTPKKTEAKKSVADKKTKTVTKKSTPKKRVKATEKKTADKKSTAATTGKTKKSAPVKASAATKKKATPKSASSTTKKKASTAKSSAKGEKLKSAQSNKQEEINQAELIERFITKEPSITAKASRKSPTNQEDLSQPSTEFKEDLISENLARIMVSQGKNDKAVDIYKKLIWKFPQKKAYFAAQIEDLKK